jgi:hypothetical protein
MSNFSNNNSDGTQTAFFKTHYPHEVIKDLTNSKQVAQAFSDTKKYQHRAKVTIVGHAPLRPYDPIYLDGLPNGMSGYWTVLSVEHIFGGRVAKYLMSIEVGTDKIGDTDSKAKSRADTRDVQGDFAGQSLIASPSKLAEYNLSPNSSTLSPNYGVTSKTAVQNLSKVTVPKVPNATPFRDLPPNIQGIKKTVVWVSTNSGRVLILK